MSQILQDSEYVLKYGNDLLKAITFKKLIGQGNSSVYEVLHHEKNCIMALKEIILQSEEEEKYIIEEQKMLKFLSVEQNNDNFIKYEDFCIVNVIINDYIQHNVAYILMEKATVSLSSFIEMRQQACIPFSVEEVIYITEECVSAFANLQNYKIAHSDIKPENILLDFIPQTQFINNTLNYISENPCQEEVAPSKLQNKRIIPQSAQPKNLIQQQICNNQLNEIKNSTFQTISQNIISDKGLLLEKDNPNALNPRVTISELTCKIKICDIGSAIQNKQDSGGNTVSIHQIEGTIPFLAPELFKKYIKQESIIQYNPYKSDAFSLGLCILYLIIQQRFFKYNRIYMDDSSYQEILSEWVSYAKQISKQNGMISAILDSTLHDQYDQRSDFLQLLELMKDKMSDELQRRQKIRELINLNSFNNLDFNEIESFSPIKLRSDRTSKNKSPIKNQINNINGGLNIKKGNSVQMDNSKKIDKIQNYKKQITGRATIDQINTLNTEKTLQTITPKAKYQPSQQLSQQQQQQQQIIMKEADLSISILEKTGELHQINGKISIISTRGKSASRTKNSIIKPPLKNTQQLPQQNQQQFPQHAQQQQQQQQNQKNIIISENIKPNMINIVDQKKKGNEQIISNDIFNNKYTQDQNKLHPSLKLPSIKLQQQQSASFIEQLPQLNAQVNVHSQSSNYSLGGETNLLAPRKQILETKFQNKINQEMFYEGYLPNNNKNQSNHQNQAIKNENIKNHPMRSTAYSKLNVETYQVQGKKVQQNNTNNQLNNNQGSNLINNNQQKTFYQGKAIDKIKQQIIQKQNQNQRIKTENTVQTPNNVISYNNERVQYLVISSYDQIQKLYEELIALQPSLRSKKFLKVIFKDILSAIKILRVLKNLNDFKNISVVFDFSLENVKIDPESPGLFNNNNNNNQGSSPSSDPQVSKPLSNNFQLTNQYSNDSTQMTKINFMRTSSRITRQTIQKTSSQEGESNYNNSGSQRSQSRNNRSNLNPQRRVYHSKNKSFSNDNLDSSFSSSQGNGNKNNLNDLSQSIIGEKYYKPSEVFILFMEWLASLKSLDSLNLIFNNFMDSSTELSFLSNIHSLLKDQVLNLKEVFIKIRKLTNENTLFFEFVKLIISNSQGTLKTLHLDLKSQLANQEMKTRTQAITKLMQTLKSFTVLENVSFNLAKNRLKKEFLLEFFEMTKQIESLKELRADFGFNQLSFPAFQIVSIHPKLTFLDLNFENNQLEEGIPSIAKQLPNCLSLSSLKLNFRQNRSVSNDQIIFLFSCLKNIPLVIFNLNISDNNELNDQLFWNIQHLHFFSEWICSDLQFNIKNIQIGIPSLISLLEYLKKHMRSFHSISCIILRRCSQDQIKELISKHTFLDHYNLHFMILSQCHLQFTLSLKQFSESSSKSSSSSLLKKKIQSIPDVLCEFLQNNTHQKRMYRCLTCENSNELKDYVQYNTSIWKYCKQCIYVCHRNHEFLELTSCMESDNQCICAFTHNSTCLLQNTTYSCTNQFGKHIFQQSFKCYDCSISNQDVYVCTQCRDTCHKDHFVQFDCLRVFNCQCSTNH